MAVPFDCTRRRRRFYAVASQLILVTIMISSEVNGIQIGNLTKSVARSIARVPSAVMDGGQYATHKVGGAVGTVVKPVAPLKRLVDATAGTVSSALGTASRLLGKPKHPPQDVMFLYDRRLDHLGTSKFYLDAVKSVLGHALTNVVLYRDDMAGDPGDAYALPELGKVLDKLQAAGAPDEDLDRVALVLGCNGKRDIPAQLASKILGTLKDRNGMFKLSGPIDEIRWIANNLNGFHKLANKEMNDYKKNTKYSKCTVLFPLATTQTKNK